MAVFLPLPDRRLTDFRIYLLSMTGSAVVLALGLFWMSRYVPRVPDLALAVGLMPFVGLGYVHALQQHQHYVNYSLLQQQVLQDMVSQAPRLAPGSVVIVADRTGWLDDIFMFSAGAELPSAVRYLYAEQSVDAIYCRLARRTLRTRPAASGVMDLT
jgi:hypothetical protein